MLVIKPVWHFLNRQLWLYCPGGDLHFGPSGPVMVLLNVLADPIELVAKEPRLIHGQPYKLGARDPIRDFPTTAIALAVDEDVKDDQQPEDRRHHEQAH